MSTTVGRSQEHKDSCGLRLTQLANFTTGRKLEQRVADADKLGKDAPCGRTYLYTPVFRQLPSVPGCRFLVTAIIGERNVLYVAPSYHQF
jgi:hypothetical protein